jgi:hypothetical protein
MRASNMSTNLPLTQATPFGKKLLYLKNLTINLKTTHIA